MSWIDSQGWIGVRRPYIWPGSWPANDLRDMARSLPGWHFDSAWIYYEAWDPEIPGAVERFNQDQSRYHARVIHREGLWQPPRDVVAVLDSTLSAQVMMSMWLNLSSTPTQGDD